MCPSFFFHFLTGPQLPIPSPTSGFSLSLRPFFWEEKVGSGRPPEIIPWPVPSSPSLRKRHMGPERAPGIYAPKEGAMVGARARPLHVSLKGSWKNPSWSNIKTTTIKTDQLCEERPWENRRLENKKHKEPHREEKEIERSGKCAGLTASES